MAFFKTAQEKEIEAQMERDEQLQAFDDRIQDRVRAQETYSVASFYS